MQELASIAQVFGVNALRVGSRARGLSGGKNPLAPLARNFPRHLPLQLLFEIIKVHNRLPDLVIEWTQALAQFV